MSATLAKNINKCVQKSQRLFRSSRGLESSILSTPIKEREDNITLTQLLISANQHLIYANYTLFLCVLISEEQL